MYSKKQLIKTVLISCAVAFLAGIFITSSYFNIKNILDEDILVRAKKIILENYVDTLTDEQIKKLDDASLHYMVASLSDPYSYYFDMDAYNDFEENAKEEYIGIGINVSYNAKAKTLMVTSPTSGGPAEKAGILPQDLILGVDNITLDEQGCEAIIDKIRNGEKGKSAQIHILRDNKKLSFAVIRDVITIDTISGKTLDNGIAYIKISEFQHNSVSDFEAALKNIKNTGAKGLIIDLRNNPGGYADSVIKMTDMLLPEGTIAYLENNKGNKEYFNSDKECLDLPMVVLVNEGTASAAELMAGSLQAYEKAQIVGMKTYGKAVGQTPYMLTEDTAIYLTSARYYTPKGECIDKKGITPDIEIDMSDELKARLSSLPDNEDIQFQVALDAIMKKIN